MAGPKASWSWMVFFGSFWSAFGKMIATFLVSFLLFALFADVSSASFESAMFGNAFALLASAIFGYSAGEKAVRDWREV